MSNAKYIDPDELLKPHNMIRLYANGLFPMADNQTGEISWYYPEIRTIIPLNNFNVPRTLKKNINNKNYEIRFDYNFEKVVRYCADREETWISEKLINAYLELYKLGYMHTLEVWMDNKIAGGLYGVTYKGAFFGESMFSLVPQASKIALVNLCKHLQKKGFVLLDVQYMTEHLAMFGAKEIELDEYKKLLIRSSFSNVSFS